MMMLFVVLLRAIYICTSTIYLSIFLNSSLKVVLFIFVRVVPVRDAGNTLFQRNFGLEIEKILRFGHIRERSADVAGSSRFDDDFDIVV